MSAIFNPATIDWNGEEVKALNETLFKGFFEKPALSMFHDVVPGIKAKKQVIILDKLSGPVGLGNGSCDPTPNPATFPAQQKFWDPEPISDRFEECWTELRETFFEWGLKNGIEKYDLTATDYFNFLEDLILDSMMEAVLRIAWFNDVDAEHIADGGVIKNTTPIAAYNRIDGLWKQIYAIVAADPARLTAGLGTRNAGASYAAQAFTPTDTTNQVVMNTLQDMMYGADERLEGRDDLIYIVTKSVGDQYKKELKKANIAYTTERIENGIEKLISDGVEIYVFKFWDRIIRTDFDNGTKYFQPHRALLTTKTNMKIGTEEEKNFSEFDAFYDRKSKNNYIDFLFNEDAMVGLDHLVQVAY